MAYKISNDSQQGSIDLSDLVYDKVMEEVTENLAIDDLNVDDQSVDGEGNVEFVITLNMQVTVEIEADEVVDLADGAFMGEIAIAEIEAGSSFNSFDVDVTYFEVE